MRFYNRERELKLLEKVVRGKGKPGQFLNF